MSESTEYVPGTYVKDGRRRTAYTVADAVALRFEGYTLEEESAKPVATEADQPSEPALQSEQPEAVEPGKPVPTPPKKKD